MVSNLAPLSGSFDHLFILIFIKFLTEIFFLDFQVYAKLLFSPDPASLERTIRKEVFSSSIDNNTCSSLDFVQPPSTQTLVPSTDTRSPPSTEDTHLPSTDIVHPTSIDTPVRTSTDTEPRDLVATLILVRDDRGDLNDQEGHLRKAAGPRIDAQGAAIPESDANAT